MSFTPVDFDPFQRASGFTPVDFNPFESEEERKRKEALREQERRVQERPQAEPLVGTMEGMMPTPQPEVEEGGITSTAAFQQMVREREQPRTTPSFPQGVRPLEMPRREPLIPEYQPFARPDATALLEEERRRQRAIEEARKPATPSARQLYTEGPFAEFEITPEEAKIAAAAEGDYWAFRKKAPPESVARGLPFSESEMGLLATKAMAEREIFDRELEKMNAISKEELQISAPRRQLQIKALEEARDKAGEILAVSIDSDKLFDDYVSYRQAFAKENPILGGVASGTAQMIQGAANAPGALIDAFAKTYINPHLVNAGFDPLPTVPVAFGTEYLNKAAQEYMPKVGQQDMETAIQRKQFGEWLISKLAANSPQIALSLASAYVQPLRAAVLPFLGATATGQSFAEGDDSRVSVAKGIIEYLSEKLPLKVFDDVNASLKGMSVPRQNVILAVAGQRLLKAGVPLTANSVTGAIEESVAQLGGNFLDIYFQGKDIPLTKGLDEAAVLGAVTGKAFSIPQIAAVVSGRYEPASVLSRSLEGTDLAPAQIPSVGGVAAEQARTEALRAWQTQGLAPSARTMEQVRDEVQAAQDLDSAIATAEQAVSEVPTRAQIAAVEPTPTAAAEPTVTARPEVVTEEPTAEQLLQQIRTSIAGEPVAAPEVTAAPRIEAPPTGRAPVAAPEVPAEAPRVPPTGRVEAPAAPMTMEEPAASFPVTSPAAEAAPRATVESVKTIKKAELEAMPSVDLSRMMGEMRETKPRTVAQMFGNNPTPDQVKTQQAKISAWNNQYSRVSRAQKIAQERDNAAFRAAQIRPAEVAAPSVVKAVTEPPVQKGFTRVYHSGSVGEGKSGRFVSTDRRYAEDYRQDLPLFYLDIPSNDPRVNNPDYPNQGAAQGFTFNFELTPDEASALRKIERLQPAAPAAPAFTDLAAKKADKTRGIVKGEVLTFTAEKQAAAYAKAQKLEGYTPREVDGVWRLSRRPQGEITVGLSSATPSILGISELYKSANAGDELAHTMLQLVAEENIKHLLSRTNAKVITNATTGLYGGAIEPSLTMSVTFDEADKASVLAALAKFASNFNQEQIHVRVGSKEGIGFTYDDGSYVTPVYRWSLESPLSRKEIENVIEQSGLYGLTFSDSTIEAYFVGDPLNERQFTNFEEAIARANGILKGTYSSFEQTSERLWAYGDSERGLGFDTIQGDVPAGEGISNETARKIAAYLNAEVDVATGRRKFGPVRTFEQQDISPQQEALQTRIAEAYDAMPVNDLDNPNVRRAYEELADEVLRQYKAIPTKVEVYSGKAEPYKSSEEMRRDLLDNNHLFIYATTPETFGPPGQDFADHPLLKDSGLKDQNGYRLLFNDLLRAVHDYYAHSMSPVQFGPKGEEAAWRNHMAMTRSPWARWALTAETRGQNSWVNFRPDLDRATPAKDRPFAEQKAALLPLEFSLIGDNEVDAPVTRLIETIGEEASMGSLGRQPLGEERAIQEPSAAEVPVREGTRGGEAVGERDAQREEAAGEGRPREAGAEEVAFREADYRPSVVNWAKKEFGDRVAPNGNPVWENFVRWFGDSQVVNEKGEPLVVYHGTTSDFSEFEKNKITRKAAGVGFYFTTDPSQRGYAEGEGANVMPVFLDIRNPTSDPYLFRTNPDYDGLIFPLKSTPGVTHIAVREPNQIKSSVGNNGNFGTEPSIVADLNRSYISQTAYLGYETPEKFPQPSRRLNGLLNRLEDGKISEGTFIYQVRQLSNEMNAATRAKADVVRERKRGADIVMEKLIAARRRGELPPETVEFALWLLRQNPGIASELGISIKTPKDASIEAGLYNPAAKIMFIFKTSSNVGTAVHEILHHSERMMSADVQSGIRAEWATAYSKALAKATGNERVALARMLDAMAGDAAAKREVTKAFADGTLSYDKHYQLSNPSEYWAVNATRILRRRYEANSWIAKAKNWLIELVERAKSAFGMRSDAYIIKGLNDVISGKAKTPTGKMLSDINEFNDIKNQETNAINLNYVGVKEWQINRLRNYQDRFIDLGDYVDEYHKMTGTPIPDEFNPRKLENLFSSKVAILTKEFRETKAFPIYDKMAELGVTKDEIEDYLYARHAPEYNREMEKRNPTQEQIDQKVDELTAEIDSIEVTPDEMKQVPEPENVVRLNKLKRDRQAWREVKPFEGTEEQRLMLSGMSDQQAQDYMDSLSPEKKGALEEVAAQWDGLVKIAENNTKGKTDDPSIFNPSFEFYVPFRREGFDEQVGGIPQGFSVGGKFTKAATGSLRPVTDILENIIAQAEASIYRLEANKIAQAMLGLAITSPNPDFWTVDQTPKKATLDMRTGAVVMRADPQYRNNPLVVVAKVPDGKGNVVERMITFNKDNPKAVLMAAALKNLDIDPVTGWLKVLAAGTTRHIAVVNTQYNPFFGIRNLWRDLKGAFIQTANTPLAGSGTKIVADGILMIPEIMALNYAEKFGRTINTENAELYKEFRREGGQTFRLRDMWQMPEKRRALLEKQIRLAAASTPEKGARMMLNVVKGVTLDLLDAYNTTFENVIRLAAYKEAQKRGLSKISSAELSKEATVNFDRRGIKTAQMQVHFAFFNSAIQGNVRITKALGMKMERDGSISLSNVGKAIIAGGVLLGALQVALLQAFDIEEDDIKDEIKQKNFIIPLALLSGIDIPEDSWLNKLIDRKGGYLKSPMPLGYNFIVNLGRIPTEYVMGGFKNTSKHSANLLNSFLDSWNPFGSGSVWEIASPTWFDPVMALLRNKDWQGRSIYLEQIDPLDQRPGYLRAKHNASYAGTVIAYAINRTTGGTEFTSGFVSPTPDQIDYLIGVVVGGVGREAKVIDELIQRQKTGEQTPANRLPLIRMFYGEVNDISSQTDAFYENIKLLKKHQAVIEGERDKEEKLRARGEPYSAKIKIMEYQIENPDSLALNKLDPNSFVRDMQNLNKEKREVIAKYKDSESPIDNLRMQNEVMRIDMQRLKLMSNFNYLMKAYKGE